MTDGKRASRRRQVGEPRSITISGMFSPGEVARIDRTAARLGWTRSRLVAECVMAILGSPGDGCVDLKDIETSVLPGLDALPLSEREGGPL